MECACYGINKFWKRNVAACKRMEFNPEPLSRLLAYIMNHRII